MPDHISEEQIARLRARRTSPEELLPMDDHISQCAECRDRLASASELGPALHRTALGEHLQNLTAAIPPAMQDDHLTYEQLESYVDGKMRRADRGAADRHLRLCQSCSHEVRDLNTFKVELAGSKGLQKEGPWKALVAGWFTTRRPVLALSTALVIVVAIAVERWRVVPPRESPPAETANSDSPAKKTLVTISALPPEEQSSVLEVISQRKIKSPDALAGLRGPHQTLLGAPYEGARFEVLEPIGEVVLGPRPAFRWQRLAEAATYSVGIFDASLNPVQSSPPLQTTQWTAVHPLNRGQIYLWQVTAKLRDGKSVSSPSAPSPEAKFRVLDQEKADELARFQAAHPGSNLVLGILYAHAGLLEQAERALALIPKGDPDYTLAQGLLDSIHEIRRR
jgi:hypothetical protein